MSRVDDYVALIVCVLLLVGKNQVEAWSDDTKIGQWQHVVRHIRPVDAGVHQRRGLLAADRKAKVTTIATPKDESLFAICTSAASDASGPRPKVLAWFQWVEAAGAIKYVVSEVQGQLLGVESAADVTSVTLSFGASSLALEKVSKLDTSSSFPVLAQGAIDDSAAKASSEGNKFPTAAALWGEISKGHSTVVLKTADVSLQGYLDLPTSLGAAISLVKYQINSMAASGASDTAASDRHSRWDIPWRYRRDAGASTDISKVCYRATTRSPFTCQEFTDGNCTLDVAHTYDNVDLCCASFRLQVDPYQVTCNMYKAPDSCYYIDLSGDPTCKKSSDSQNCTGSKFVYTSMENCDKAAALLPKPAAAPDMAWDRGYESDRYSMRGEWDPQQPNDQARDNQDQMYDGYRQRSTADHYYQRYDSQDANRGRDAGYRANRYDRQADYMAQRDYGRDPYQNDYERSSRERESWGRNGYDNDRYQDANWGRKLAGASAQQQAGKHLLQQTGNLVKAPQFSRSDMSMWAICEPVDKAAGNTARPKVFAWFHWSDDAAAIKYVVMEIIGAPLTGIKKKADISSVTLTVPGAGSVELTKSKHDFNRSMDSYTILATGMIADAEAAKASFPSCWDMWRKILGGTSTVTVGTKVQPKKPAVTGQVDLPAALGAAYLHVMQALGSIDVSAATPDRAGWDLSSRDPRQDNGRYQDQSQWGGWAEDRSYDRRYDNNAANDVGYQSESYTRESDRRGDAIQDNPYHKHSHPYDNSNDWAAADTRRDGPDRFNDEAGRIDGSSRDENRQVYEQDGPGRDYYREDPQARWERERYEASHQTTQDWQPYRG